MIPQTTENIIRLSAANNKIKLWSEPALEKKKPEKEVTKATIQCTGFMLTTVARTRNRKSKEIVTL